MADTQTADPAAGAEGKGAEAQDLQKQANTIVETIEKMDERLGKMDERQEQLSKDLEEAKKTQYPAGAPFVRKGEDIMSSRPYSLTRLAISLNKRRQNDPEWDQYGKVERDLSHRLRKAYSERMGYSFSGDLVPLATDLMPTEAREVVDAESGKTSTIPGLPTELVKECRDIMSGSLSGFDPAELGHLEKQGWGRVRKDMSANVATTGGTLVAFASQGELIDMLRGVEVFTRAGAQEIDLPPQGSIRFPRVSTGITISAYAEAASVSESTPGTGHLLLSAKKYSGVVDVPEELIKFATSVAVESWLRGEFVKDLGLKTDADMIYGAGGTFIQGAIAYSGARTVTASTTGASGDTVEAQDPDRLYADIADQNALVDDGSFFYSMTNTLWSGLSNRRGDAISANDAAGPFVFNSTFQSLGGGRTQKVLNGNKVITSTQIPTNRVKTVSTLTLVLAGVASQWLIARSGVIEFKMTDSDGSKFLQGLSTMRGTMYCDAGPRTEASFGMIDTLVNS